VAALVGLDGDDVAAVAQGDDGLLGDLATEGRVEDLLEPGVESVVSDADVAAEDGERGAGGVGDLGAGADAAIDVGGEVRDGVEALGELSEEGQAIGETGDGGAQLAGGGEGGGDVEKLGGLEGASEGGLGGEGADVAGVAEADAWVHLAEVASLGGEALTVDDLGVVGGGAEGEGEVAAGREGGMAGQAGQDLVELQDAEGVLVQGRLLFGWAKEIVTERGATWLRAGATTGEGWPAYSGSSQSSPMSCSACSSGWSAGSLMR